MEYIKRKGAGRGYSFKITDKKRILHERLAISILLTNLLTIGINNKTNNLVICQIVGFVRKNGADERT